MKIKIMKQNLETKIPGKKKKPWYVKIARQVAIGESILYVLLSMSFLIMRHKEYGRYALLIAVMAFLPGALTAWLINIDAKRKQYLPLAIISTIVLIAFIIFDAITYNYERF